MSEISENIAHRTLRAAIQSGDIVVAKALDIVFEPDAPSESILTEAACSRVPQMLATVWEYYKRRRGANADALKNPVLMHLAACIPENLEYLLAHGANINALHGGVTPLLAMLQRIESIDNGRPADDPESLVIMDRLFPLYMKHGADLNAKDTLAQDASFYVLQPSLFSCLEGQQLKSGAPIPNAKRINAQRFLPVQVRCLEWALKSGMTFTTPDKFGKTPFDYFSFPGMWQEPSNLDQVFIMLAKRGYNVADLMKKHADASVIDEIRPAFEQETERVRGMLAPPLAHRLWTDKGEPSELLLSACGHGILGEVFEDQILKPDGQQSLALYRLMEEKLPSQCQDFLRNGFDKPFLRELKLPERSSAVITLLKRREAPGSDPSSPGRK